MFSIIELKQSNTGEFAMEKYLNMGIKDVIKEFPKIESILTDYDIACGPCMVGTCLLKDILSIHALPESDEKELMERISGVILNGNDPGGTKPENIITKPFIFSKPMQKLVDEHTLIKRWLALIPGVVEYVDLKTESGKQIITDGIDMIRSYADKFHHGKEEDILFKYFDESAEIIQVMYQDHTTARGLVQNMIKALESENKELLSESLLAYRELLQFHIQKEDEILYPWMDRQLNETKVIEMDAKFVEADKNSGITEKKYEDLINDLEKLIP
jgi:hemerythrin-like domain-containing protein